MTFDTVSKQHPALQRFSRAGGTFRKIPRMWDAITSLLPCFWAEAMWQRIRASRRQRRTATHANVAGARTHNYARIYARANASLPAWESTHFARTAVEVSSCTHAARAKSMDTLAHEPACTPPLGDVHKWAVQHVTPLMNKELSAQAVCALRYPCVLSGGFNTLWSPRVDHSVLRLVVRLGLVFACECVCVCVWVSEMERSTEEVRANPFHSAAFLIHHSATIEPEQRDWGVKRRLGRMDGWLQDGWIGG